LLFYSFIVLKEETIDFLKKIPPFTLLSDEELEEIADDIAMEYYPRGVKVLTQSGPPSQHLRIIKKGGVKVFVTSGQGQEMLIDYRSEGDQFGMLSVLSGDRSRANVVAVDDTICYIISREKILSVVQRNPAVNEYFLRSFFINFIDKTYDETRKRCFTGTAIGDRRLFTTPVGDIVRKEPVTCGEDTPIQKAAGIMAEHKISSLVIAGEAGAPMGIVTDRDLREKVVARGRELSEPVRLIMSSPLIKVDAEEYCFEALMRMMRYKIHHILVVERGQFKGIVTNHDFMVLQGASPTVLVKEMEDIQSFDSLGKTTKKLHKTVSTLLREGARAHNITGLITELIEKLLNRIVDMIERELGPSPLPYSMFLFGDGARRELTLSLRLRLGVAYEDTNNLNVITATEQYFQAFITRFAEALSACNVSGGGADCLRFEHIRSHADWKDLFHRWTSESYGTPPVAELFDMRVLRGEEGPVDSLVDHLFSLARENEEMMDLIATDTVTNRPPLGFFRRFVVEKSGEHKNELNIHEKGIRPLVDAVRTFAIEKGHKDVQTMMRLSSLRAINAFELAEDAEQAFEYLNTLLIHNQLEQIENGDEPDTFLNPEDLANLEKQTLRECFQLIANLFEIIEKSYRTERVP
jgi:CBS domain-containing protein